MYTRYETYHTLNMSNVSTYDNIIVITGNIIVINGIE